jgi:DNA-binding Lrp family transcriptional regulator
MAKQPKISKSDAELLGAIELNADRPSREVAKQLKRRDYSVQHALRRLKERKIIQMKPFVDISLLGTIDVGVYFSLGITRQRELSRFLKQVVDCPKVAFVQSMAGDFYFLAALHAVNLNEVRSFLRSLSEWSHGAITSKEVSPRVGYRQYRRKYLTSVRADEPSFVALESTSRVELSSGEMQLLACLANGNFDSIRHVARILGLPYSTVDRRYQQLLDKGVIRGWFYDIDESVLGINRFKLLVTCRRLTVDFESRLENFSRRHRHVTNLLRTLGSWDFEIGVEYAHSADVMSMIAGLYEEFPEDISSIRSLTELETYKFNMFPDASNAGRARHQA